MDTLKLHIFHYLKNKRKISPSQFKNEAIQGLISMDIADDYDNFIKTDCSVCFLLTFGDGYHITIYINSCNYIQIYKREELIQKIKKFNLSNIATIHLY